MRRNASDLRAEEQAQSRRLRTTDITAAVFSRTRIHKQSPERSILSLDQDKPNLGESVDEMLSSALLAQDKELAGILQEVDRFSKGLKSESQDDQTFSNTLQRAVLCAVKQALLDRELRSLALTDDLTCLYNRRAFLALATQQVWLTRRKSQGLLLFRRVSRTCCVAK